MNANKKSRSFAFLRRVTGCVAFLTAAMAVILSGKPGFSNASRPPRGIANPVVALEMARDVDEVDAILGEAPSPDREAMRVKQYIDFGFIACYATLYVLLSVLLGHDLDVDASARVPRSGDAARKSACATTLGVCGVAAAIFDAIENFAILRICDMRLSQTTQAMVDAIRRPSLAKWTLAFIAMAL